MLKTLLTWTNLSQRKPEKIIIYGLNQGFAFNYLKKTGLNSSKKYAKEVDHDKIKANLNEDMVKRLELEKGFDFNNFSNNMKKSINKLGLIDCIAVKYPI